MKKTVILTILDGWGIGPKNESNPIHVAKPQNINYVKANFPSGALQASGIAVGLPWDEEGNSEVGHLTIGAGRVIYQHFPKITLAIRDGSFFNNPTIKAVFEHAKRNRSAAHFVGLLSSGNVHASLDHLNALLKFAEREGVQNVRLHLFADGKDSPPKSLPLLLGKIPAQRLASISGRYYAMDREQHWDRTEKTYNALVGNGSPTEDYRSAIEKNFSRGLSEEFLEPMLVGKENWGIRDNDAVFFFNFREDSMRQLAAAFVENNFAHFKTSPRNNLRVASMTAYSDRFSMPVAFPAEKIENPLGKILANNDKSQVRVAETEKYAHVTYFFNGYKEAPLKNEYRIIIPSKNIARHDQYPEMMAREITSRATQLIEERAFDFILINYANPDVIAHTGDYDAALKAIAAVDEAIGALVKTALANNATLIITSDHGNIERMLNPLTGIAETKHDANPVPIYLVDKARQRQRTISEYERDEQAVVGIISDIAPTVLELLSVQKPDEMTGGSLLPILI